MYSPLSVFPGEGKNGDFSNSFSIETSEEMNSTILLGESDRRNSIEKTLKKIPFWLKVVFFF